MSSPVFFTDRDLGRQFPLILREADLSVEPHDNHFPQVTADVDWLSVVGERGWVVLTHDRRIRYTRAERDILMRAGVRLFVLIGQEPTARLARNFLNTLPRVRSFLERHVDPFIARIYMARGEGALDRGKSGSVKMWLTWEEWREDIESRGSR